MSDKIDPLILNGLRFGGLLKIVNETVVARYNKALEAFGLSPVAEVPLYIDQSGFSLDVANALRDLNYMDPAQVNPRFIIVSAEQASAPLVNSAFSSTKKLLKAFFEHNAEAIEKITLKDALYGEIDNSLLYAQTIEDIVSFPHVDFEFHTVEGLLEDVRSLELRIERFKNEENGWMDIGLMQEIVELAIKCGDVRKHPLKMPGVRFKHPTTFSARLFGGVTIIEGTVFGKASELAGFTDGRAEIVDTANCEATLWWLDSHGYLEAVEPRWLVESGFLEHKLEMVAADLLADKGVDLSKFVSRKYPESIIDNHHKELRENDTFRQLDKLRSAAINKGDAEALDYLAGMRPVSRAMVRRANPDKPYTNDVNRILSLYQPCDYLTTFILDKPSFYDGFRKLDPVRQDFAVNLIKHRYMPTGVKSDNQKQAIKDAFFGSKVD